MIIWRAHCCSREMENFRVDTNSISLFHGFPNYHSGFGNDDSSFIQSVLFTFVHIRFLSLPLFVIVMVRFLRVTLCCC